VIRSLQESSSLTDQPKYPGNSIHVLCLSKFYVYQKRLRVFFIRGNIFNILQPVCDLWHVFIGYLDRPVEKARRHGHL